MADDMSGSSSNADGFLEVLRLLLLLIKGLQSLKVDLFTGR